MVKKERTENVSDKRVYKEMVDEAKIEYLQSQLQRASKKMLIFPKNLRTVT